MSRLLDESIPVKERFRIFARQPIEWLLPPGSPELRTRCASDLLDVAMRWWRQAERERIDATK